MRLSTSIVCTAALTTALTAQPQSQLPAPPTVPAATAQQEGIPAGAPSAPYRVGGSVSAPRPIATAPPNFPEQGRDTKHRGTVVLWLVVDTKGIPRDVRVVRSFGMGLDEKAVEAVKQWRFEPARKDGKPVAVQINVEVNFSLTEPAYSDLMQKIVNRVVLRDEAALREIERSAQAGNVEHQLIVGCLYMLGPTARIKSPKVLQFDPTEAGRYFDQAARAGSVEAEFLLAINAISRPGPVDLVQTATWLNIAAASGLKPARKEVKQIEKKLTPEQLAEAHRRADEWLKSHPKS